MDDSITEFTSRSSMDRQNIEDLAFDIGASILLDLLNKLRKRDKM